MMMMKRRPNGSHYGYWMRRSRNPYFPGVNSEIKGTLVVKGNSWIERREKTIPLIGIVYWCIKIIIICWGNPQYIGPQVMNLLAKEPSISLAEASGDQ